SSMLPAVILHFYLVFPRPKPFMTPRSWWPLLVLYGPPALFMILIFHDYVRIRSLYQALNNDGVQHLLGPVLGEIYVYFGVAGFYYLASVVSLLHSYRTAANAVERNQVRWILLGAAAALMPLGYSFWLAFWRQDQFAAGAATWPMFAASVCVTLAYTVSI